MAIRARAAGLRPARPGQLAPAPGPAWEAATPTRRRAAAIAAAIPGTTTRRDAPGRWNARIPAAALPVTATHADETTLTVTLDDAPQAGPLTLAFHPWHAADVMPPDPPELPAAGQLSISDIRISTLMGRTVRYLIPAFTPRR